MNETFNDVAPTKALGAKVVFAALTILKKNSGEMRGREVVAEVEKTLTFNDWEKARFEKSGYIRWQSVLHFYTIDCIKAGYLIKKKGIWYLTPEGEEALKLGQLGLLNAAQQAYRKWRRNTPTESGPEEQKAGEEETQTAIIGLDEVEQLAQDSLTAHINKKNPYEFQELVAALLRGMGYYTPFVSPRGKDGGVDIIAYRDPLGTVSPRIKVQVKHRESPATVQEIRQLMGLLQREGNVGIFLSTGGFTSDAVATARDSHVHVELIDLPRFLSLWEEFYQKLPDEDKSKLPLLSINFLPPNI